VSFFIRALAASLPSADAWGLGRLGVMNNTSAAVR